MGETKNYRFEVSHYGDGRYDAKFTEANRMVTVDEDTPWPKVLNEFCMFLSGVYGYDIAEQIMIHNKYMDDAQSLTTVVFDNNGHTFSVPDYPEEDEDC